MIAKYVNKQPRRSTSIGVLAHKKTNDFRILYRAYVFKKIIWIIWKTEEMRILLSPK
jgi:hypothetical protein